MSSEQKLPNRIKEVYSRNSTPIWSVVIHVGLACLALVIAYDSYKEITTHLYGKYYLSPVVKKEIKGIFPLCILTFAVLSTFCLIRRGEGKGLRLTLRQYVVILLLQAAVCNLFFFSKSPHTVIVSNSSIFCLVILLLLWGIINKFIASINVYTTRLPVPQRGVLPNRIKEVYSQNSTPIWSVVIHVGLACLALGIAEVKSRSKEEPSLYFILTFMGLLILSTLLLTFDVRKVADRLADVAYFSLAAGLGIEIYYILRYGARDEKH